MDGTNSGRDNGRWLQALARVLQPAEGRKHGFELAKLTSSRLLGFGMGLRHSILPVYQTTHVEDLERRRKMFGWALVVQLVVCLLRLWAGHIGGGSVALFLSVIGNRARCSLAVSTLSAFIALISIATVLDSVDLVENMLDFVLRGLWLLVGYVYTGEFTCGATIETRREDLEYWLIQAVELFLAPLADSLGAWLAWNSYLSPGMVFADKDEEANLREAAPATGARYSSTSFQNENPCDAALYRGFVPP